MKTVLLVCLLSVSFILPAVTVHRSFRNGYPAGSGVSVKAPSASVGVRGAEMKESARPKEKDNGQCWAVTQAGTRCKNKKDGTRDYCRIHAADRKPLKPVGTCRAMTWEGTRCTRPAEKDRYYCKQHAK